MIFTGRRVVTGVVTAALAVGLGACGSSPKSSPTSGAQPTTYTEPADYPSTIATALKRVKKVDVYSMAGGTTPSVTFDNPSSIGVPRVFLVTSVQGSWLHVLLPIKPNGSSGWIPKSEVKLSKTNYWVKVERNEHHLYLYRGKKVVISTPIGIGTDDTPTPGGVYYVTELLKVPEANSPYGPYAYGLSGYSPTLKSFDGTDPEIGMHGTNEPSLIGKSVSHGCIRVPNTMIARMAGLLPLGTPVHVLA